MARRSGTSETSAAMAGWAFASGSGCDVESTALMA